MELTAGSMFFPRGALFIMHYSLKSSVASTDHIAFSVKNVAFCKHFFFLKKSLAFAHNALCTDLHMVQTKDL